MSRQSVRPHGPSDPTSRPRRRLLALLGATGLFATSGCLSALGSSGESNTDVDLTLDRLEYRGGFEAEADPIAGTYGRHGVWGHDAGPTLDGPTYVGAYRDSLAVPRDEGSGGDGTDGNDGGGDQWVTADFAAVVYHLEDAYRVWLWAGARARQPDSGIGRASLTRVSVGAVAGEGWELSDYAPRGAIRDGPVPVSMDDRGPGGLTPLPGGGIGSEDGGRTGPNGQFAVAWQGIARGVRSVNAVCEFRRADDGGDEPFATRLTVGTAGGRGAL